MEDWLPLAGSQTAFLACPIREKLYEGNRGPGKTSTVLASFAAECGRGWGPAWRGLILRREYKHLDDILNKAKKMFFPLGNAPTWAGGTDYRFTWPTGEQLYLRAVKSPDDYWSFHGHEYPCIIWDELTQWQDDSLYMSFMTLNRATLPKMPRMYLSTANPWGAGHAWVKNRFRCDLPGKPKGLIIRDKINRARFTGRLAENTFLATADPEYRTILEAITDEARRKAWLEGSWDIHYGTFFDGYWDGAKHIIRDFDIPLDWPRWRAGDWGTRKPYSIGWYTRNPEGQTIRYRELYGYGGKANTGSGETAGEVAARMAELERHERDARVQWRFSPMDHNIFMRSGHSRALSEEFVRHGIFWQPAPKGPGSRINGAALLREEMHNNNLLVFRSCTHWLRTVPGILPDPSNPDDVDTDSEDHAYDETRYSLMSRQIKARAPISQRPVVSMPVNLRLITRSNYQKEAENG